METLDKFTLNVEKYAGVIRLQVEYMQYTKYSLGSISGVLLFFFYTKKILL